MDPATIKLVDDRYGPLDWRLPESSAVYWATVGLQKSNPKDRSTLRRAVYQSLKLATLRGRIWFVETAQGEMIRMAPNLDLAEKTNAAYKQMIAEEESITSSFEEAHAGFLRELVFLMYSYNRLADAEAWMRILRETYPNAMPAGYTVEEYALRRLTANVNSLSQDEVRAMLEALAGQSLLQMAIGDEDASAGFILKARQLHAYAASRFQGQEQRVGLPSLEEILATRRAQLLEPGGMDPVLQARLRTRLGLPPPDTGGSVTDAPPGATPLPPPGN
jgi:hypothetical protein